MTSQPRAPLPGEGKTPAPGYRCSLFAAEALVVALGANQGDAIAEADEVCLDDIYQLLPTAEAHPLVVTATPPAGLPAGHHLIAEGSGIGQPGEVISLGSRLTLMAPDGDRVDILILHHHQPGGWRESYALPLSPIAARVDYTLIKAEADPGTTRLSDLVCISFTRGTLIALADGRQVAIETLRPGDRVLTRDHGPQPLRWIARATLRAQGSFAPVVITAGTLGNSGDLIVSQHHRMFLYQRNPKTGLKAPELLVQSKHLIDGERIFLREGGYVDYLSLIFDRHEIVYAEGIPAESLMVNEATLSRLPEEIAAEVKSRFPDLSQHQHFGTEAGRQELDAIGPQALFKLGRTG